MPKTGLRSWRGWLRISFIKKKSCWGYASLVFLPRPSLLSQVAGIQQHSRKVYLHVLVVLQLTRFSTHSIPRRLNQPTYGTGCRNSLPHEYRLKKSLLSGSSPEPKGNFRKLVSMINNVLECRIFSIKLAYWLDMATSFVQGLLCRTGATYSCCDSSENVAPPTTDRRGLQKGQQWSDVSVGKQCVFPFCLNEPIASTLRHAYTKVSRKYSKIWLHT